MDALRLSAEAAAAGAAAALAYHYLGYPALVRLLAAFVPRRSVPETPGAPPSLSVIIPCYNEEAVIAAKLADLRAADYAADKVEVVVVSDGSEDGTAAAAQLVPGVRVIAWPERRGKPAALNAGAAAVTGDVLVFTDANARLKADALRELVAPFADPGVGAVCGEQVITTAAGGERAYWRYEGAVKRWEAAAASVVGADGSLYAVRRSLYRPVPERRLIMDDFFVSLAVVAAGRRLAYNPAAVAYEDALASGGAEFRRKIRIMAGSLAALGALGAGIWLRLPFQLFSHKILRWLGPFFLGVMLVGGVVAAVAGSVFGWVLTLTQGLMYISAAAGWALGGTRAPFVLRAPYYFVLTNAALAAGWLVYIFGPNRPAWRKLR